VVEPPVEPKVWSSSRTQPIAPRQAPRVEHPMPRATPQVEQPMSRATPPVEAPISRATSQAETPTNRDQFDLAWSNRGGQQEPARREPDAQQPQPVPRPRETKAATARSAPAERGPAILKAGVIDGMPYTLYADGSIEAELAQGTVKFASVDALRAHLEKQS
jgi:hypothetical protein